MTMTQDEGAWSLFSDLEDNVNRCASLASAADTIVSAKGMFASVDSYELVLDFVLTELRKAAGQLHKDYHASLDKALKADRKLQVAS